MTNSAYYDEELAGELRSAVAGVVTEWPGVAETETFGCPSFTADGTLFAVVATQGLALTQLPDDEKKAFAEAYPTESFAPGERRVDSWVVVPRDAAPDDVDGLVSFLRASYESARGE
ncbi:TfoX/Sxy family protein [Candidatus Halobonum tyrrellensis]|uniref:YdhG-like domain-containing protein n=1 Tax=Candidatus Halobonum tyrrellensis G22 TaxID=1324957 RepID=V4HBC3_9EURY|nr:TfoX/Sxy family protein [Candidatus Halobonum tyrrellensis]ESP88005.1 hypothetical protein K933_11121 [Candidatus Halobonum tyrrellensis G22]